MQAEMKKNRHLYFMVFVVFIIYLAALCYMLFFAESFGRGHIPDGFDKINLVPFREMQRFISKWETVGAVSALLNTLGNVIGFIPLGIFVPILLKKTRRVWKQLLMGFAVSLAVETIQLVFDVGVFDVDDLILNTVGTIVGYALFRLIVYMIGKRER